MADSSLIPRLFKRSLLMLGIVSPVTALTFFIVWFVRNPAEIDGSFLLVFLIAVIVIVLALIPITLFLLMIRLTVQRFLPIIALHRTGLMILLFLAGVAVSLLLAEIFVGQFSSASELYSVTMLSAAVGGGVAGILMATEKG